MTKPTLPSSTRSKRSRKFDSPASSTINDVRKRSRRSKENSAVLVSAVISTYLLSHLHHVLQRAEYGAVEEGRVSQAAIFAQLRKVLCMDARSMKEASAVGLRDADMNNSKIGQKVA